MERTGPVEVYVARDRTDAQFALDHLLDHGISARLVGGDLRETAGGDVGLGISSAPAIWVPANEEKQARDLIEQYEGEHKAMREDPAGEWQCPACNEVVGDGFSICWNCEAGRPGDPSS